MKKRWYGLKPEYLNEHGQQGIKKRARENDVREDVAKKNDKVSVDMTGFLGWENFNHCFLDGTVVKAASDDNDQVLVKLNQFDLIWAPQSAIQSQRGPTKGHAWKKGDKVHVYIVAGGVKGWWKATIVKTPEKGDSECWVRWEGDYEEHDKVMTVKIENMRLASDKQRNEVTPPDKQRAKKDTTVVKKQIREEEEEEEAEIETETEDEEEEEEDMSPVIFSGMAAKRPARYRAAEVMIAPSSIAPGGYGLYSLRNFEVGEFLPVTYHGRTLPVKEYDELDDYLLKMANMSTEQHRWPSEVEINFLKSKWGVEVRFMDRTYTKHGHWQNLPIEYARLKQIDWDSIYDHFSDYSFEYVDNSGKNYVIYWPIYNYDGRAIVDERNVENAGLMLNEPPNMDYYFNQYTRDDTLAVANVKAEFNPKVNRLGLKVISPIEAGEELLLCYGPLYRRHGYFINTSPVVGCGQRAHLQSYLKQNFTYKKPLRDQLNAEWKRKLANFPEQSRESFYSYLDQVNGNVQALHSPKKLSSGPRDYNTYNVEIKRADVLDYLIPTQYLYQQATPPSSKWRRERKERNDLVYVSRERPSSLF